MHRKSRSLVVGLGNPGRDYAKTRHNIGFMVIDKIAETLSIQLVNKKFNTIVGMGVIEGMTVILAKPRSYMNRSGLPTRQVADYYRIDSKDMIVIHDDIDLAFNRIKLKEKGGDGGHRGIRSIKEAFGGGAFNRVRIGVGRGMDDPGQDKQVVSHVLGKFDTRETRLLDETIDCACEAVVTILCKGIVEGMNSFNKK
ncbi:MAG: aminoacyl-tRNA hydrolase [Deltaproteobacteria bacterium]|nr:aminoacyl-tRNA hydrolase [Deltaproteobacteria bacterium]